MPDLTDGSRGDLPDLTVNLLHKHLQNIYRALTEHLRKRREILVPVRRALAAAWILVSHIIPEVGEEVLQSSHKESGD
jgi:hypothetical protein